MFTAGVALTAAGMLTTLGGATMWGVGAEDKGILQGAGIGVTALGLSSFFTGLPLLLVGQRRMAWMRRVTPVASGNSAGWSAGVHVRF